MWPTMAHCTGTVSGLQWSEQMKQSGKDKTMSPVWTISKKHFVEEGIETMKNFTIFFYIPNESYIYCFLGSVLIYFDQVLWVYFDSKIYLISIGYTSLHKERYLSVQVAQVHFSEENACCQRNSKPKRSWQSTVLLLDQFFHLSVFYCSDFIMACAH